MNILEVSYGDNGGGHYWYGQAIEIGSRGKHEVRGYRMHQRYIEYPYYQLTPTDDELFELYQWADCLHIHDNANHTFKNLHLPIKPAVMQYHGIQYRRSPISHNLYCDACAWPIAVATIDLETLGGSWAPVPRPDMSGILDNDNDEFLVIQCPTRRNAKGTNEVVDALADLPSGIRLEIIEGLTYEQCIERKRHCDLFLDQWVLGFGTNAIEAWAMGIPVISNASNHGPDARRLLRGIKDANDILDTYYERIGYLPFCRALPGYDLREKVLLFKRDVEFRERWAEIGHATWSDFFSYEAVWKRLEPLFDEAMDRAGDAALPTMISYREWANDKGLVRRRSRLPRVFRDEQLKLVRYLGRNVGRHSYRAPSGVDYQFSALYPERFVYESDLSWILSIPGRKRGKRMFERVE